MTNNVNMNSQIEIGREAAEKPPSHRREQDTGSAYMCQKGVFMFCCVFLRRELGCIKGKALAAVLPGPNNQVAVLFHFTVFFFPE